MSTWRGFLALKIVALLFCAGAQAQTEAQDFDAWVLRQLQFSVSQILDNIDHAKTLPNSLAGNVVASPGVAVDHFNNHVQDYRFHWVRDGALVTRALITVYQTDLITPLQKQRLKPFFDQYLQLTKIHQQRADNFGEPKFYLDGSPFTGAWGRPQNDGPALRAIVNMGWLSVLEKGRKHKKAQAYFLDIVQADLEYTAKVALEKSFDIWEEVFAHHFNVAYLQVSALERGAVWAERMKQPGKASYYRSTAATVRSRLKIFYNNEKGFIEASRDQSAGHVWNKTSGLDIAVVLAFLHSDQSVLNEWLMGTIELIRRDFIRIYNINQRDLPGYLVGRYPEDSYFGGNPWPLTTLSLAEIYYRMAEELGRGGEINISALNVAFLNRFLDGRVGLGAKIQKGSELSHQLRKTLLKQGDTVLARVRLHMGQNGELYEQFHRETGELTALPHLTWSYAAMVETLLSRERAYDLTATCEVLLNER